MAKDPTVKRYKKRLLAAQGLAPEQEVYETDQSDNEQTSVAKKSRKKNDPTVKRYKKRFLPAQGLAPEREVYETDQSDNEQTSVAKKSRTKNKVAPRQSAATLTSDHENGSDYGTCDEKASDKESSSDSDDDDDKTQSSDNGEKSECESDIASGNDSAKDDSAKKARTVPRTEPRTVPMYRGKAKTVPKKTAATKEKENLAVYAPREKAVISKEHLALNTCKIIIVCMYILFYNIFFYI
jgi:hypothetical protein